MRLSLTTCPPAFLFLKADSVDWQILWTQRLSWNLFVFFNDIHIQFLPYLFAYSDTLLFHGSIMVIYSSPEKFSTSSRIADLLELSWTSHVLSFKGFRPIWYYILFLISNCSYCKGSPFFCLLRSSDCFNISKNQPFSLFINSNLFLIHLLFFIISFRE